MTCLCTPTLWLARSNQARWIQPISTEQDLSFTFLALWQSNKAFHLSNPVKPFQNLIILDFSGPSDIVDNPSFLKHSSPLALSPLRPLRHTFFAYLSLFFFFFYPSHSFLFILLFSFHWSSGVILSISMALTYNLHANDVQTFFSVLNSSPLYPMPILKNSI